MQAFSRASLANNLKVHLNVDIKNESQLEFIETLSLKEKYGDFSLAHRIDETNEGYKSIKVYHFKFKNDEYIIADCLDSATNGNFFTRKVNYG